MKLGHAALALALVAGAFGCGSADGSNGSDVGQSHGALSSTAPYLALGDSVAFGYNPVDAQQNPFNLSSFTGYPELMGAYASQIANAACPGETSGSFLDVTAPDNGCHVGWRSNDIPLHVAYATQSQSQIQYALAYLAAHPNTDTVSVGIGANDLLLLQQSCASTYAPDATAIQTCVANGAPAVIMQAAQNVGTILGAIRQSGFAKNLVVVTYYATSYANPNDPQLQAIAGLDRALVQVAQTPGIAAYVARGFSAFAAAAAPFGGDSCKAGLLYVLPDGTCDKHPSQLGQSVLDQAVVGAVPASTIDLADPSAAF